ncbi:MAG: hypothetical protein EAZ85_06460 [Bacteroidetes bacterium]|nr:MAG: hypothetical protein EAZ85_06460 [Bacteroidota bacterium]TAG84985.1 MAG: hypothetical protein EAZ20_16220 [Bacteroidota bacterium]
MLKIKFHKRVANIKRYFDIFIFFSNYFFIFLFFWKILYFLHFFLSIIFVAVKIFCISVSSG